MGGDTVKVVTGILFFFALFMAVALYSLMFILRTRPVRSDILIEPVVLRDSFILGVDYSGFVSPETNGKVFLNQRGAPAHPLALLANGGTNYVRITADKNNVPHVIAAGRHATLVYMRVLLTFCFSGFCEENSEALYRFAYETVTQVLSAGVNVGMIKINATPELNTRHYAALLYEINNAVRNVQPGYLLRWNTLPIAMHITGPIDPPEAARQLHEAGINYDIFGISVCYDENNNPDDLLDLFNTISREFNVQTAVFDLSYPFNAQRQARMLRDVIAAVAAVDDNRGAGVFLSEETWLHFFDPEGRPRSTLNLFRYLHSGTRLRRTPQQCTGKKAGSPKGWFREAKLLRSEEA